MDRVDLEIAKTIGVPIEDNLKVPVALAEIADVSTAEPGEEVKYYASEDANDDDIYVADANGVLTLNKLSASAATALSFIGLQSKLEYVLINDVMAGAAGNRPDTGVLGRKKASITRSMDKQEVKRICDAILGLTSQEVTLDSGEDLYDGIVKMVHLVEDFGDNFVLLAGSTIKEKIDIYDKVNADNFHYRIGIKEYLDNAGIKLIKVTGKVNGGALLAAGKCILVARDSTIAQGKPIIFVRRRVSPEIAAMMGATDAERLISVAQAPTIIDGTNNLLGYGVFGFEAIIEAIVNFRALAWSDELGA
jgi:hypothetical protein